MDRYDPYTDSFIVDNSNINQFHVRTVQLVELTDECIDKIVNKIAEALERKKGRWTKKEEYLDTPTVCTLCGHEYVEYVEGWEWEETGDLPNYCPNCGADMRGEKDGE